MSDQAETCHSVELGSLKHNSTNFTKKSAFGVNFEQFLHKFLIITFWLFVTFLVRVVLINVPSTILSFDDFLDCFKDIVEEK